MKHNNVIPNAHFHKQWAKFVKTWFDQPSKKIKRRAIREGKAKRIAPRPLQMLRPAVRCPTVKYNRRLREGRGFTLAELQAAGINVNEAAGLGISVDHRRRNKSEEGFQKNVQRLKLYKSKLIVFPRKASSKRARKGDTPKAERAAAKQVTGTVLPIQQTKTRTKARKVSDKEREVQVTKQLRKALTDSKLWGMREKRAKEKAEAAKAPKASAQADDGMDE
jgi:large subunit ribosomal protein L13e